MKTIKIVHCANFSESKFGQVFYSIDRKISNGLIRNNYFVYDFSYREIARNLSFFKRKKAGAIKMNEKLILTLDNIKPDLLLLGHSELVNIKTLKKIKELYPSLKIAMWWVDPFDKISHIDERLPLIDAFFATTSPKYYKNKFRNTTNFYYLPNICDDSIEVAKSFEKSLYDTELIFLGRTEDSRKKFIDKIKNIKNLDFKVYGDRKESLIFGQDFLDKIANSKMSINFSRYNEIPLYSSDRVIQLLAQGTLVFCPKIPEFEELFSDDEIVYFDDIEDLENRINFYKNNTKERIKISQNGWNKAHKLFNSTYVTKQMVNLIIKGTLC